MFENECETEVNDDLPATQRFVSHYQPDEACLDDVLLCDSSSDLLLFGYLHGC